MNGETKNHSILAIVSELALLLGIYTYFTGWVYSYYFFHSFDITLGSLDIPLYYFIVYSFSVYYSILGGIVFVVLGGLTWTLRRRPQVLYLFLILAFPIVFETARHEAFKTANQIRFAVNNDRTAVWLSDDALGKVDPDFVWANGNNRLRLLTETNTQVILFYQAPTLGNAVPFASVYQIDKSKVLLVRKNLAP